MAYIYVQTVLNVLLYFAVTVVLVSGVQKLMMVIFVSIAMITTTLYAPAADVLFHTAIHTTLIQMKTHTIIRTVKAVTPIVKMMRLSMIIIINRHLYSIAWIKTTTNQNNNVCHHYSVPSPKLLPQNSNAQIINIRTSFI